MFHLFILETLNLTRTIGVTIYCYEINFIVISKSRTQKKQLIVIDQLWHLVRGLDACLDPTFETRLPNKENGPFDMTVEDEKNQKEAVYMNKKAMC